MCAYLTAEIIEVCVSLCLSNHAILFGSFLAIIHLLRAHFILANMLKTAKMSTFPSARSATPSHACVWQAHTTLLVEHILSIMLSASSGVSLGVLNRFQCEPMSLENSPHVAKLAVGLGPSRPG